ncbi:pectinesterase-like [Eucalyptus grandis]|uniref:pectinesterase-like n=1 Tax=Eucalyptus grandis TaxID=71139 RepID=UPI00192F09CD|nr:pectinesterase-like [Eucalyptus grandis]
MATTTQPLLNTQTSHNRSLCLILSLIAIILSFAVITDRLIKTGDFADDPLARICSKAQDQARCRVLVLEIVPYDAALFMSNDKLLRVFVEKMAIRTGHAVEAVKDVRRLVNDLREEAALADCVELMEMSVDRLEDSTRSLREQKSSADVHTWLSSSLTNYVTCLDGFEGSSSAKSLIEPILSDLISRARTSLAIFVSTSSPEGRKPDVLESLIGDFPSWVTGKDRRLLQSPANAVNADVVVAKDGSGKYKTVKQAIAAAPSKAQTRYVIHVKKGTYKENVEVAKTKKNIMLVGDGMNLTVITGSLNVIDGSTTFKSATVAVNGDGFIAQDIWFQNTAGPQKHQAVALRVSADKSVINRCRIDAYQDTLYTHTNRQFYRDSYITGTVDFIFGDAGVVFQNCKLVARKPMRGQSNMVTAQGRTDPYQNTGISIQRCHVIASSDLAPVKGSIKSYLGRPWKLYSRTVVMQSNIGDHIDPTGWSVWSGDHALKTLYYGEYMNKGPGAGTSKRVKWPGYHVITSPAEAKKFTVAELIQGGTWLKSTGVSYTEGL